jgi:hypothetical protein
MSPLSIYDLPVKFSINPALIALKNAVIGLIRVRIGPKSEYVSAMESIPVSGVEVKKERHAPLFAPCLLKPATAGTTPQEHRGMGIPNNEA